jgi:hypothetical protein
MLATHNRSSVLFALTVTNLYVMAAGDVPSSVAQRRNIKFLFNKGEKAADIHRRLHE